MFSSHGIIDLTREAAVAKRASADFEVKTPSTETPVANLSGGNQQKVLFAREVLALPTALLVDEPTKGIDIGTRSEIYRRLRLRSRIPVRPWWCRPRTGLRSKGSATGL